MRCMLSKYAIILSAAVVIIAPRCALAQTPPDVVAPTYVVLANKYIEFKLGVEGEVTFPAVGNVEGGTLPVAGRFGINTKIGDPEVAGDDNQDLILNGSYPCGDDTNNWSAFKVKIGNLPAVCVGDAGGEWTKVPQLYSVPSLGKGRTGPYIEGEWAVTAPAAGAVPETVVRLHISLVRDLVRLEMTVINNGIIAQSIGMGMYVDVLVDNTDRGGFPFVPGVGLSRMVGSADQFYGSVTTGTKIPSVLDWYDSVDNPITVARTVIKGQDCTPPDYFAVGEYLSLYQSDVWLPADYVPDDTTPIDDMVYMMIWRQAGLAANASKKVVTYYGVGAASSNWTHRVGTRTEQDTAVLAVAGPRALKYDSTDSTAQGQLKDDIFKIKAYIYNLDTDPGRYDLENASAFLFLPKGLQLTATSGAAEQEMGFVGMNSEGTPVEWEVQATGEYSGELEYYVSAKDPSGWQQMVSRKIFIPATKQTVLRSGYQMMSVPFTGNNPIIEHLFEGWDLLGFFAKYYDPTGYGSYQTVSQFEPGKAFWVAVPTVRPGGSLPIYLAPDAAIIGEMNAQQLQTQYIDLEAGWNMIGTPFVYPMYLGQIMMQNGLTNETATFDNAVAKNWISRTVFSWNAEKSAYETLKGSDSYILPWRGYWVRNRVPLTLVFRPSIWPGSGVSTLAGGF